MHTNKAFAKSLKAPASSFYLCDFHVHSPGSADTRIGQRFAALSNDEKLMLPELGPLPNDLAVYEKQVLTTCPAGTFYDLLLKRRNQVVSDQGISDGNDWAFVAITDHNVAEYAVELSCHAWQNLKRNRLVILPGIELDVSFMIDADKEEECAVHLLCIFSPLTNSSDIRIAIAQASNETTWSFGKSLKVSSLATFVNNIRHHPHYPAICIAAHVGSSKGIQAEVRKSLLNNLDAAIARTSGELVAGDKTATSELRQRLTNLQTLRGDANALHNQVLHHIGNCGLDALQVRSKNDEKHYRRLHRFSPDKGRAIPLTSSDAHAVGNVFANENALSFIKLAAISSSMEPEEIFKEIRDKGLRYGDTRFSYAPPGYVNKWISGVEIIPDAPDAESFWPFVLCADGDVNVDKSFVLPFSRNLNCLIGGRGSGKSAAIEAIAFVTQPKDFDGQGDTADSDRPEWYKRAYATLRGCLIRICWKSSGGSTPTSLFLSRYFDPNHEHSDVVITDSEGKEVLSHTITPPIVALFRIHDIEEAAKPERLLDLFDSIKGNEVAILNRDIDSVRSQLSIQRAEMIEVAKVISELTKEKTPLREFVRRKRQFMDVNKPEVKQKYEEVDAASEAELIANDAVEDWQHVMDSLGIGDTSGIEDYFQKLKTKLDSVDAKTKGNCAGLLDLLNESTVPSRQQKIAEILNSSNTEINQFCHDLQATAAKIAELHKGFRDQLSKDGLPTGGKDREAKKKAFEDAEAVLDQYRTQCRIWNEMLVIRNHLRDTLENKCILRTRLRKETADELTRQLRKDLDASVLIVEADARPVADKDEFSEWLTVNFVPSGNLKYRSARICGIVERGIMPAKLRDILLSDNTTNPYVLVNNVDMAEDGRIDPDECDRFVADTMGRDLFSPEVQQDDVLPEIWNDLPEEVRTGLWQFNLNVTGNGSSRLDASLQLDEIVFDDLPEIRLNDRPSDTKSLPRPLGELSPGQRCSAILPIILLTGSSPLLIDQPEDNLDNRLIRQVIVNILASMKLRRQVIVATHNPNLPVLGDAEQAIILRAVRERGCELETSGNLDSSKVVNYITDIMEGGREAFQYRQSIYQSHWEGPIGE